ncbi:hypothetical protein APR04_004906 [Promicromonospora umidemergens]|uniref:Pyrroloquinoline-quinone binding quinoprotein n=1 Tax=Promicromonospora umidemergens TaxID=629679 RepID=A0ABP8WDM1_9MICO|nr:hypothetical protein [Promicromonospora umidemergens]MCP2285970.1 hypothetical protein [Promicromonospora umidemergens]
MRRRRTARAGVAAVVVVVVALAGCGATEPEPVRQPRALEEGLPEVDRSGLRLPSSFEEQRVVDPGWETTSEYADGVFLGAREQNGVLEFTAVDVQGEVLWAAQRPVSCSGFTVTTGIDGRALAILTDTETTSDALAGVTATAYDLTTGHQVWGPVHVPGPSQGPGAVFAAPPDGPMGDTGPRTALDPATGRISGAESDGAGERILGEYRGTLLVVDEDALVARDSAGEHDLWRISLAEYGWTAASLGPSSSLSPGDGLALIKTSGSTQALIDLDKGTVLSDTALDAAVDVASNTLVVLDDVGLHAYDAGHERLWSSSVAPETTIAALGGVFLYLREGGNVRVHNVLTGDVAQAYDPEGRGPITVPTQITSNGAAMLGDGRRHLLATIGNAPTTDRSSL